MATDAADATVHMRRVIEISEIRYLMNFQPIHRLACLPAFANRSQFWIRRLDLGVTIHTGLSCRYIRVGGNLYVGVAVSAIHSELSDMDVMRKRDRLDWLVARTHIFRRQIVPVGC